MSEGKKEVNVIIKAIDETVPGFKAARHHVGEFASEAKKLIAEAFVGFTVFEFFKTAIEKSTEAEQSYVQLSNTLANVGVSYEHNKEKIDETIKSLQKVANVRTDEAIKGFNTLVQRSGDYKKSLDNMVLVADLAKAKHLEFNEAAELVGRVMGGNTRVLKQFGIVTKDASDGIAQLKERLHGAAAADLQTFGGQVEALKIKFFNLAEAFGDVITGNSTLGDSFKSISGWLVSLTEKLEKNAYQYGFWFSVIIAGLQEVAKQLKDVVIVAFNVGKAIGDVLNLSWGNPDDAEKRKALFADMAEANKEVVHATNDMSQGFDRFGDAVTRAHQKAEAAVNRTEAQLDRAKRSNDARLAARGDAEAELAQKKLDIEIGHAAKVAELDRTRYAKERAEAQAFLAIREAALNAELAGLTRTHGALEKKLAVEDRLAALHKAQAAFDGETAAEKAQDQKTDKLISDAAKVALLKGQAFETERAHGNAILAAQEAIAIADLASLKAVHAKDEELAKVEKRLETIRAAQKAPVDADSAATDKAIADDAKVLLIKGDTYAKLRALSADDLAKRESALQKEVQGLAVQAAAIIPVTASAADLATQTQRRADATDQLIKKTGELKAIQDALKAPVTAADAERDKVVTELLREAALRGSVNDLVRKGAQDKLGFELVGYQAELAALARTNTELDKQAHLKEQIRRIQSQLGQDEAKTFGAALSRAMQQNADQFRDATGAMRDFKAVLGSIAGGELTQFAAASAMAFGAMIAGSQTAGEGFRRAMLGAIAAVAKHQGDFAAALVPIKLAEHDFFGAGKAAAGAAAMYAVAGGVGAISAGSGGSSGAGGAASQAFSTLSSSNQNPGTLTVIWPGNSKSVIDPADPNDQDAIIAMFKKIAGNRQIALQFNG